MNFYETIIYLRDKISLKKQIVQKNYEEEGCDKVVA